MHPDSTLQVNLNAVGSNLQAFRRLVGPTTACCGVIKSDGYGLGARHVAAELIASGATMLAVFRVSEVLDLLESPLEVPILLMGPVLDLSPVHPLAQPLLDGRVHLVLHDERQLDALGGLSGGVVSVHLELDTGMCRGGCAPEDAQRLVARARALPAVRLAGVMTHFTSAGTDAGQTRSQHMHFVHTVSQLGPLDAGCQVHAAATAATLRDASLHHDMVRIGLGWCGYVPGERTLEDALDAQLTPAIRWTSRIVHVRRARARQSVGYGGRWSARRDTTIGIIPVGYADGVPTRAGASSASKDAVRIAVLAPGTSRQVEGWVEVVGAVSMDQIAVDLGTLPDSASIAPGREVEIISPDPESPASLCRLAARCGLTPHQVLAGIGPRVVRSAVRLPTHGEVVGQPVADFSVGA